MDERAVKKAFGEDYPTAATVEGVRKPLAMETRFRRFYHTGQPGTGGCTISRFMDGSASMSAEQLQKEWPGWTSDERLDFCDACVWLYEKPDFAGILRYAVLNGGPNEWVRLAQAVASYLPQDEAFRLMRECLSKVSTGHGANIIQAIAATKHPEAVKTLHERLDAVWGHVSLWRADDWLNQVAFEAILCVYYLLELGALPADYEDKVRKLSEHTCSRNREDCRRLLSPHYLWL